MSPRILQIRLKWTARITGLLVCIFFLLFAISEVIPTFNQNTNVNSLYFIMLLSAAVVGYIASWQWEIPGAVIQLISGVCLFLFLQKQDEVFLGIIIGVPFIFTGILLIYSWVVYRISRYE